MKLKKIKLVTLIIFLLNIILFSSGTYAHTPENMILEYNSITTQLNVTITHNTLNTNTHYIYKVEIKINNVLFLTQQYTSQPTTSTFTYTYSIPTNSSDEIKVTAFCVISGSITRTLIVPNENSPLAPVINGPKTGKTGINYDYSITTIDPDSNDIFLYITWGDGTNSGWIGPYNSGEVVVQGHTWSNQGTYNINAKAKDTNDNEGPTGTFEINIPRSKFVFSDLIQKYVQVFINKILTGTNFENFLNNYIFSLYG